MAGSKSLKVESVEILVSTKGGPYVAEGDHGWWPWMVRGGPSVATWWSGRTGYSPGHLRRVTPSREYRLIWPSFDTVLMMAGFLGHQWQFKHPLLGGHITCRSRTDHMTSSSCHMGHSLYMCSSRWSGWWLEIYFKGNLQCDHFVVFAVWYEIWVVSMYAACTWIDEYCTSILFN